MRELVGGKNTIGRTAAVLKSPIKRPLPFTIPSYQLQAPYKVTSTIYRQWCVWQPDKHFCGQQWNDASWRPDAAVVCDHGTRIVSSGTTVRSRYKMMGKQTEDKSSHRQPLHTARSPFPPCYSDLARPPKSSTQLPHPGCENNRQQIRLGRQ